MEHIEMEDCTQKNMNEEQKKHNECKKWNHPKKN